MSAATGVQDGTGERAPYASKNKTCQAGAAPRRRGLYLQVAVIKMTAKLNKSWLFRCPSSALERKMSLGSFKTFGLGDDREKAKACRPIIANRQDPIEARKARSASKQKLAAINSQTVERCARDYMAAHEAGWRNAKRRYQWTATPSSPPAPLSPRPA
jgi:Arm DNA-binding domain